MPGCYCEVDPDYPAETQQQAQQQIPMQCLQEFPQQPPSSHNYQQMPPPPSFEQSQFAPPPAYEPPQY